MLSNVKNDQPYAGSKLYYGSDPDPVVTSSEVAALLVFDQPFVGSKLYYYDYRVRQNRSCILAGIELILLLSDLKDVVKLVWNYLCSS